MAGPILVPVLVFLTVFAVLMAAFASRRQVRAAERELRRRLGAPEDDQALLQVEARVATTWSKKLAESGVGWTPAFFRNWTLLAAATGLILGVFAGSVALSLLLALVGAALLPIWVSLQRTRRLARLDQQMPQALQLMVLALRAGHALPGALALAAREAPEPIREELRVAHEQHGLGRPIGEVVGDLAVRLVGCDTAQTFAVAVLVLEQTGGNLIQVIERIIDTARARTQYRSKLRALTAQGRSSARILAAIPPLFAIMVSAIDPNYSATLLGSGAAGLGVIILAGVLWLCGVVWTSRLVAKV